MACLMKTERLKYGVLFLFRVLELQGLTEEAALVTLDRNKNSPLEPGEIPIDSVAIPSSPTPNGTSDGK